MENEVPMKYSKYFGTKRHRFIKIKSVLAPKGALHLLSENIRYDKGIPKLPLLVILPEGPQMKFL